ncbi:esterase/lipase [Acrocarpospora corrugata]|uniref:Esterase/lipase n=1 Tax=Acrocarpospora corrugata TaxID=35763 RepID=A0A5M3W0I0_9ACTN|nr:alpha/beta hydrolase [Acrocarpospora corrugata]GES01710.1 esterase/lipase [Acrocarpospora corrugata]
MTLHPQAVAYLKSFPADLGPDLATITDAEIVQLRGLDAMVEQRGAPAEMAVVRDEVVAGVPVRIYRQKDGDEALPVLVYYHGGGWVYGSVQRNDALARDLAARSACVVVSVDYRLAPEHTFPAAAEDSWAVLADVFARPEHYGADAARIAVIGDSAGGNLAAVVAWQARDAGYTLAHQVLIYPVVDVAMDTPSYAAYASGFGLGAAEMAWFIQKYADGADPADPRLAPSRLADMSGLAPATVVTAECDPLCDEGAAYADALRGAGVPVDYRCYPGSLHGFYGLPGFFDQAGEARDYVASRLNDAFAAG